MLAWRLARQFVAGPTSGGVADVARRLVGVQAQVHSSAELAFALRRRDSRPGDVTGALWDRRELVKTWSMRGTLHYLAPDDLPAACAALGALRFWEKGSWRRGHGVAAAKIASIMEAVPEVLEGRVLTREELVAGVTAATGDGHLADALGSGWGALLKPLAMTGRLLQGPPRDGRVTFARPEDWIEGWPGVPSVEEGDVRLARAFLGAHGPGTPETLDSWLSRGTSRKALPRNWFAALADELVTVEIAGEPMKVLAEHADGLAATRPAESVHLLPGFDQYVMGAPRGLEPLLPAAYRPRVSRTAGWISPVVVYGGRVTGVWELKDGEPVVETFEAVPEGPLRAAMDRIRELSPATR